MFPIYLLMPEKLESFLCFDTCIYYSIFWETKFLKKQYIKNFKIKTRIIKSLMEDEISSFNKVSGWVELDSPDPLTKHIMVLCIIIPICILNIWIKY